MRRRRILFASEPMEYGVLSYLERVFEGLDPSRWEAVLAFSPRRMAPQARRLVADLVARGVRVASLPFHRGVGVGDAVAASRLVGEMRAFRPDLVHLHSTKAGIVGRLVARRLGIGVLYTPHGTSWHYTGHLIGRIQLLFERALRRATDLLVSVCVEEARAFVHEVGFDPDRVRIIQNGVRIPDAGGLERARDATRADLGIAPGEVWAIFVGRLTREKGLDVLLGALGPDVPLDGLLVIGEGPERPRLEARATRAAVPVRFVGYQEDVARFLPAADVFVQPSRSEGLPFSVLEAMAHGLPVVGSDVGGLRGAVGECGSLVPPDDPAALAATLSRLAGDAGMRAARGAAARARAVRDFSAAAMLEALHSAYDEAAAGACRKSALDAESAAPAWGISQ